MRYCKTKHCLNEVEGVTYCSKCRNRKSRKNNPISASFRNLKSRAKQRGIDFNLTLQEFTMFCTRTDYIRLKGTNPGSLSIDRIQAWRGYSIDNIQVLTVSENSKKARREPRSDPDAWRVKPDDVPF